MRKTKKKYSSPYPISYSRNKQAPLNLKRQAATNSQKRWDEDTIIYGQSDNLPLIIAKAVSESPATTACIGTISQFIKGSGFSNQEMMKIKIDEAGTTLWQLHTQLSDFLAYFDGFSTLFKFNSDGGITNALPLSFEALRFKMPQNNSPFITHIKHNPYFGTDNYKKELTCEFPVYCQAEVEQQIKDYGIEFTGQVYYYGRTDPMHRFYPVPKYWSAKDWIYIDSQVQSFHKNNLDNGFFQSVLMTVIGDPNEMSTNPDSMIEVFAADGVTKIMKPGKTIGQEFNEMMQSAFSGHQKAGNVMVQWARNQNEIQKIQEFPSKTNDSLFETIQNLTTKNITIATQVPSILANISEGVSLGSTGNEMQKAVELMQSRTVEDRNRLEQFYNEILLPNLATPVLEKVSIVNFNPISTPATIEDKFWEFMNEVEKADFIKKNFPGITLNRAVVAPVLPGALPTQTTTAMDPNQEAIDQIIRSLSRSDLSKLYGYANDYKKGRSTLEQTKIFLRAFKLTDDQILLFLNDPEGDGI